MPDAQDSPLSLLQHFDAPRDFRGAFGWLCGYSADAHFLDQAAERFTRETVGQRAHRGRISLALMLDPGQPAIGPVEAPGVAHLPLRDARTRPFRLLHAKVALLGFQGVDIRDAWRLRLIVSTGNWTRQTMEESLDLAWFIEVGSNELDDSDHDLASRCGDVEKAWALLQFLQQHFDLRLLDAGRGDQPSETAAARDALARWVARCGSKAGPDTRFFDNRKDSLLAQLVPAVQSLGVKGTLNYLAMGSGFFESAGETTAGQVPTVLARIVRQMRDAGLLSASATIDVFVNPLGCQAVAGAVGAIVQQGWSVWPAARMEALFKGAPRSLHGKFLFSARGAPGKGAGCGAAWVYLGSGNLTGPGFANRMSPDGGNLEAGVIFAPKGLTWPVNDREDARAVTRRLPIQRTTCFAPTDTLVSGSDMPTPSDAFVAPPVAWLMWHAVEKGGLLCAESELPDNLDVLDPAETPCTRTPESFCWSGERPRQVRLRWRDDGRTRDCWVPVMDEFGRLAATDLAELDFDSAWWALAGFPAAPEEEGGGRDDEDDDEVNAAGGGGPGGGVAAYPVRQMMELVENIADRQTALHRADWTAWCTRLEQTLCQIATSPVVAYFRDLGINPLSALRGDAFRPDFAEDATTPEGRLYEAALARVEAKWAMKMLHGFEEAAQ